MVLHGFVPNFVFNTKGKDTREGKRKAYNFGYVVQKYTFQWAWCTVSLHGFIASVPFSDLFRWTHVLHFTGLQQDTNALIW